jgi:hypothetical protein
VDLIYFILICFGITQILCFGTIFDAIRPKYHFFHCPMCVGFWAGALVWSLSPYTELFTFDYCFITGFFLASLSSGTSYTLNMLISDTGLQVGINKSEVENVARNN